MTRYALQNIATGRLFDDSGWLLADPQYNEPTLIRTIFENKQLQIGDEALGFYKFADWLPITRQLQGSSSPVTYRSEGLAKYLKLDNLYITFNGWWPEKGAFMRTCSFKETEAYSVCARLSSNEQRTLVVASAGNTARAFAKVCSDNHIPLLLCVPYDNLNALWFDRPLNPCVRLFCTPSGSDYYDAIELSDKICQLPGFFAEGGAKNVARRDGMGTTVLSAVSTIGRIPDYYFQAIGSGTGTIAAWEANLRLIEDGRFGTNKMTLCPAQNYPFTPMCDAWNSDSRQIPAMDPLEARRKAGHITAKVLSNRKPPYGVAGGLYDALKDAGGLIGSATNEELMRAATIFEELEGIDIHPAAGVATAWLMKSLRQGLIDPSKTIMLNITGGGEKRYKASHQICYLKPTKVIGPGVAVSPAHWTSYGIQS